MELILNYNILSGRNTNKVETVGQFCSVIFGCYLVNFFLCIFHMVVIHLTIYDYL